MFNFKTTSEHQNMQLQEPVSQVMLLTNNTYLCWIVEELLFANVFWFIFYKLLTIKHFVSKQLRSKEKTVKELLLAQRKGLKLCT